MAIEYYKNDSDTLKLKALFILLENMKDSYGFFPHELGKYKAFFEHFDISEEEWKKQNEEYEKEKLQSQNDLLVRSEKR